MAHQGAPGSLVISIGGGTMTPAMDPKVRYRTSLAEYDAETAAAMLRTGRYLYVGFMCH